MKKTFVSITLALAITLSFSIAVSADIGAGWGGFSMPTIPPPVFLDCSDC